MENENELPAIKGNFYERLEAISLLDGSLQLRNAADVYRFSIIAKASGLVRRELSDKDVFMIVLNGIRLRLDPLEALASSYIVNSKISLFGEAPRALVESSGLLEDYDEYFDGKPYHDDFKAVVVSKRKGRSKPLVSEFSVLDAKEANLWDKSAIRDGKETSPWQLYRKDMLLARARARNLKGNFPDVLRGTNIISEHEAEGFDQAKPSKEAKVVEPNFSSQFNEVKESVRAAEPMKMSMTGVNLKEDQDAKAQAKAALEKNVAEMYKETAAARSNEPMRPARSEAGPSKKAPDIYEELRKRLDADKITDGQFAAVMADFGFQPEPDGKLPEKAIRTALKDWGSVISNLPSV